VHQNGCGQVKRLQRKLKEKQGRQQKTPRIKGKGATLVPGIVKLLHHRNKKNIVDEDQEGCKVGLKLDPDKS
jgi:hypothetical protein